MHRSESNSFSGIDSITPVNERLSGKYLQSFAYYTIKERLPVILTVIVDSLVRHKSEIAKCEESAEESLKTCIGKISKLKNEIQTNKKFIEITGDEDDVNLWNDHLTKLKQSPAYITWFESPWLFSECYMYRRLHCIFEESVVLKNFDYFAYQKKEAFEKSKDAIQGLGHYLLDVLSVCKSEKKEHFMNFLRIALWGNCNDLSINNGLVSGAQFNIDATKAMNKNLLHDDSNSLYDLLYSDFGSDIFIVDYVLDNAAFELFCDLCFCDFICETIPNIKINFHFKRIPWYVSDATHSDFKDLIDKIREIGLDELANRWQKYSNQKIWMIHDEAFWTTPFPFSEMPQKDPILYERICHADLVVFKGDLNYRKLLQDINWRYDEGFAKALGLFQPKRLVALRTVKSDLICGLSSDKLKDMTEDLMWMRTGEYGVIQKMF